MTVRLVFPLLLLFALQSAPAAGQSSYDEQRTQLKKQQETTKSEIQSLEKQIDNYRNRLEQTSERYEEMYRQYDELTRLIALQEERIRRMQQEQQQIHREMELIEGSISELETELNLLIEQYQSTLRYLYKHGRTTEIALLLTSTSVNQLLVRSFYLSKFNEFRESQEAEIRAKQTEYEQSRRDLDSTSRRNEESLARIRTEIDELSKKEEQQKNSVEQLQQDRDRLQDQLAEVEEQRRQLDETLTALIEEEEEILEQQRRLAAAREIEDDTDREEAVARYSQPAARTAAVSDEELGAFEVSFRDSRGQLPWPVEGGTVTERFGERVHPDFGTRTNNPGVDIAASPRSQVQAVHDGYVFAIQPLPGFGDVVMVHHGRYKTVYGNLSDIFVSRDRVLNRGDIIGLSGDENTVRGEVLFFLIRDGSENVNPENWIRSSVP